MIAEAIRTQRLDRTVLRKQMEEQMKDLDDMPMEISKAEATEGRMNALRKGNFYKSAIHLLRRLVQTDYGAALRT